MVKLRRLCYFTLRFLLGLLQSSPSYSTLTSSVEMTSLRAQILETAHSFITSFNEFTPESVVRHRSPTCLHRLRPGSLDAPPRTNAEYSAWVVNLQTVMRGFKLHLIDGYEPMVDDSSRQVVLYLRSTCDTDLGQYENEYIWILKLNEGGTAIDDIVEFADSAYTLEWIRKLQEAVQRKNGLD